MPRVQRILFCTWQYHPEYAGGAERQARLQAEELIRRGHVVEVVCPRAVGSRSGLVSGVRVHRLWRIERWPLQRLTYFLSLMTFLLLKGRKFSVIHVHLGNLQADMVVFASKIIRRPVHVKLASGGAQGELERLRKVARITRWYGLRHAESVQALSAELEEGLLEIGIPPSRVRRIPNGIPGGPLEPLGAAEIQRLRGDLGLPQRGLLVLFVGRFATYKGIDDLLEAWAESNPPDAHLILVGTQAIDRPTGPITAQEKVLVHGWTDRVNDYLRATDVFVSPSHSEGMSNALLEAMSAGTAIVATRVGAAAEMLHNGECGVLVEPRAPHELSKALTGLLNDAERRNSLAHKARSRAAIFEIGVVVSSLEDVYSEIARDRTSVSVP